MIGPDDEVEEADVAHAQDVVDDDGADDSQGEDVSRKIEWLEASAARRLARKPDVSKLSPGVKDGVPQFDKGTRVVVERRMSFVSGNPWLDTCVYTVLHVDLSSGIVEALSEERGHRSFLSFKDKHHDWYLCPKSGNPLAKKRRMRRRRNQVV